MWANAGMWAILILYIFTPSYEVIPAKVLWGPVKIYGKGADSQLPVFPVKFMGIFTVCWKPMKSEAISPSSEQGDYIYQTGFTEQNIKIINKKKKTKKKTINNATQRTVRATHSEWKNNTRTIALERLVVITTGS